MGKSGKAFWELSRDNHSGWFYRVSHPSDAGTFYIALRDIENIGIIVHEINECEVTFILRKIGYDNDLIRITKIMCKKYPWLFHHPQRQIWFSHLISPFGRGNCILSRNHNQLRW